jgi:hypothetical protein
MLAGCVRAVLRHLAHRTHGTDDWLRRLLARRNKNIAAVALANKNARIAVDCLCRTSETWNRGESTTLRWNSL